MSGDEKLDEGMDEIAEVIEGRPLEGDASEGCRPTGELRPQQELRLVKDSRG